MTPDNVNDVSCVTKVNHENHLWPAQSLVMFEDSRCSAHRGSFSGNIEMDLACALQAVQAYFFTLGGNSI